MKKTHEEYVNELAEINPDVEVLGTYINTNTPLTFRCKVCGHIWEVAACNLLRGTKCPKCNIRKRMLPEDEAIKRMEEGSPNTEVIGAYKGYGKTIECRCRKCGYEWKPYPRVLMKGCGCPRCAGNAPKGDSLGLTADELAFYDALTKPQAIKDFYENEELIAITKELADTLRKNRTIDWQKRDSARAKMRMMIKKLLKKHKYPPEGMEDAVQTVMTQCELWTDNAELKA